MAIKTNKKEILGNRILQKVAEEKLKSFDLKNAKNLIEIVELLRKGGCKSLSNFAEFIQTSRPELIEKLAVEHEVEVDEILLKPIT